MAASSLISVPEGSLAAAVVSCGFPESAAVSAGVTGAPSNEGSCCKDLARSRITTSSGLSGP